MLKLVHAPDVVTTLVVSDAASMTNIVPANNLPSEYAPDVVTTLVVSDAASMTNIVPANNLTTFRVNMRRM